MTYTNQSTTDTKVILSLKGVVKGWRYSFEWRLEKVVFGKDTKWKRGETRWDRSFTSLFEFTNNDKHIFMTLNVP